MIELAKPGDAPVLASLHAACFPYSPWSEAFWVEAIAEPKRVIFLLNYNGQPAGFLLAQHIADEAEILTIGVLAQARGRGFGQLMVGRVHAHLKAMGCKLIFLEVEEDNLAARAVYAQTGFVKIARRSDYYGPRRHAIVMRATL